MLEEAIVDCHDEEEAFSGVVCTLEDELQFPFDALVLGKPAEILGIDGGSGLHEGIVVKARIDRKTYRVALFMVDVAENAQQARWIAFAKWWMRG
ncbi:MAG: hypothetical protein HY832_04170 [Candidatus Aenigmarchaeota archaeon]|nr:hypothetical protein [Candidatus Aenigmarchaeota archaeon]